MADKKIQMKLRNAENTDWDNLYPIPDLTDYVRQPGFGTTAGEANTYTVGTTPAPAALVDGMGIYLKINATNTGASTLNWDSLGATAIKDSKGNALTAGKLTAGAVIGVKYNSTTANFILLGEGGSGSAVAGDLLFGKTATVDSGDITGTMPNNGALGTITPTTSNQSIPAGYTSGGTVAGDADLVGGNIKSDVNIFGVSGTFAGTKIKSIQVGISTLASMHKTEITATITSVTMSKSILLFDYYCTGGGGGAAGTTVMGVLTNSTTVTFTRDYAISDNIFIHWKVIEFEQGVTVQRGTTTFSTSTKNITVSSININKSYPIVTFKPSSTKTTGLYNMVASRLTSNTNLEVVAGSVTSGDAIAWQVVSFD